MALLLAGRLEAQDRQDLESKHAPVPMAIPTLHAFTQEFLANPVTAGSASC
jgi:hypothetical protein